MDRIWFRNKVRIPTSNRPSNRINLGATHVKTLAALLLLTAVCGAQNHLPTFGQPAPAIALQQMLQAPSGAPSTLAGLHGKAVVVEFWATWCGGCVAAIPHLNQLVAEFKDKPVVFLSITDEPTATVQAFLKKRTMGGWIGIDKDAKTFETYGILGRPQTLLIDANGVLQTAVAPEKLDATLVQELMDGKTMKVDERLNAPVAKPMELVAGVPPPLLQVLIRPAAPPSMSGFAPGAVIKSEGGRYEYYGLPLRTILYYTEGVDGDRIVGPAMLDEGRYDLSVAVPEGQSKLRKSLMQQMVNATFQLKMHREQRTVPVWVLSATPAAAKKIVVSKAAPSPGFRPNKGEIAGSATTMDVLGSRLKREVGDVEVIDETGMKEPYDFDLNWKSGDTAALVIALRDQLGLKFEQATRPREFLVIDSAVQPMTWAEK